MAIHAWNAPRDPTVYGVLDVDEENAMAYVERELGEPGTELTVDVRGTLLPVTVTRMPFIPQRYYRG